MILMDIEHELRAMDQARLTTDGIHFDSIEGQAWLNRVFQERLDELEAELFDTGVLREEGTASDAVITTFVPPSLKTRLGTVPAVTNYRQQSSSEPGQRTDVKDRLGEAPMRRTIHPRRRLGPVKPIEETAGTSRSDTRSETTSTSRQERRSGRGSLMWSRPIPSPWHVYKDELMKLDLQRVSFIEDARRMLNGATLSVSRLYSITGVDWLIAASINFSSTTALRFADLEGLPSNNTMGPVNARPLQDVRLNHDEGNREERPGRFLVTRPPIGQHVKMFWQVSSTPGHAKERIYPKLVNHDGDAQRYGGLKAIKKDETIFAAYDKAEMRKAKIMIVANSEFVYTSKSLFWPDVIMLAAVDLDLLQSISLAIGVQRQTDMNPITIVFAGINDHLHSRGFLSRIRDPTTAENAVWPAIKDILESMCEVVDATKEGSFTKVTPRIVFALSPGYAHLPDGLKFVYAIVTLLSEGKYDVIISAPNRMIEMENLRPLKAELSAVWSDISNAMRGFKDPALHMLVLDEVLGLELSNFSRQLKLKPGIDDDHRGITAKSIEVFPKLWNLRPYDKTNGEITRVPRLTAAYHKVREETKDWGDYEKLPEAIPEFPLIRRMLLGAVSVVQAPRLRAFETNERRVGNFMGTIDLYFVGRNAAVLQYTRFAYTDQATRRRISNAATPKPGRFDEEWTGLGLAPMKMRGRTELPEASLILTSVKPELKVGGTLQARPTLIIPRFPEGADNDEQGPSSSNKDMSEGDDGQGGSRQTEEPMQQDANQADGEDDRASTGGASSLDFNIFSDLENNADTLETTEPADEGISTLEPPSAFMEMKRNLPESSSPGNSRNNDQRILMGSPRRRRIEASARVPFLGTLPEEEWEVHHRDHKSRTGRKLNRVAFMEEVWTVVQSYGTSLF